MASGKIKKHKVYSKTRASKETTARRGLLTLVTVFLLLVGLTGLWLGLSYVGSLFFSRNQHFEMKHIVMRSDGRLSESQLIEYAELEKGVNLFAVDFDVLREKLESVSLVDSVRFRRKLPETLFVDVTERTAVAQVSWKWLRTPFLVDHDGVALPPSKPGMALPLIEGKKFEKNRPGESVDDDGVRFALKLLSVCDELGLSSSIVFERFDLRSPDHITATLEGEVSARFPRRAAKEKLIRLARVMEIAREQGQRLKTVDLTPDGLNVPTTHY